MAREWEEPQVEKFDPRATHYVKYNRRMDYLQERRFDPSSLIEQDLRSGDTRRFLQDDGTGDLNEVYRVKNSFEGLVD